MVAFSPRDWSLQKMMTDEQRKISFIIVFCSVIPDQVLNPHEEQTIKYSTIFIVSPFYRDVFMLRCKLRVTSYWLSHISLEGARR